MLGEFITCHVPWYICLGSYTMQHDLASNLPHCGCLDVSHDQDTITSALVQGMNVTRGSKCHLVFICKFVVAFHLSDDLQH